MESRFDTSWTGDTQSVTRHPSKASVQPNSSLCAVGSPLQTPVLLNFLINMVNINLSARA